jgi:transcriptional regulator with XRE-family HTH domain
MSSAPPKLPEGVNAQTPKAKLDRAEDTARALNMTRQGMTVRAIARVLGCSPARVHKLVKDARLAIPAEERDLLIAEIVERERGLIQRHWPLRADPDSAKVIQASDKLLMSMFGLEAPQRVDLDARVSGGLAGLFAELDRGDDTKP